LVLLLRDAGAPLAAGVSPDVDGLAAVASAGERRRHRRLGQVDVEMKDPSCKQPCTNAPGAVCKELELGLGLD
jgi:hypothetical protein